jgi:LysR family pca operon transcriptional activator
MLAIRIRFRHLRSFLTIAQLKSVGRAAAALSVTQPALSKTLRELEQALGVRLFERGAKGMELTKFGRLFLQRAASSLTALQQGIDEVRAASGIGALDLTIGVMPNVAPKIMPLAVKRFRDSQPKTSVHIVGGSNARLLDLLRVGDLDCVVGRLGLPESMLDVTFEHLYAESLVVVARPDHKLAARASVSPKMLAAYPP